MKKLAIVSLGLALATMFGHVDPAVAGPRCGYHAHWVGGHWSHWGGHRHWVRGHCV